jgi:hypothetical protein
MATFVRMNALLCTVKFTDPDTGAELVPTTATLSLSFKNTQGVSTQALIPMTYNPVLGVWTALWDSAAAQQGNVDWTAYGSGVVHAAQEGSFQIRANPANNQNNA